ncbi:MAG: EthD family reductase [Ignavibacteriales bacterium]|nr:EthD family reductase [Ignavibacteriales bacterium]
MIKVSVLYPNNESNKFDIEYYRTKHVNLVTSLLGDSLKGATTESGLGGGALNSPAPFVSIANMYFNTIESFQNSFGPNADKIMGDLPNFTNIEPIIQISEVVI